MSNILVIIANPNPKSFSFAMAEAFTEEKLKLGHSIESIDLYRSEPKQDFFTFDKANRVQSKEMDHYQSKIIKADEIVFFFPYWWGSYPAILHNFIDWNFSKGFAFKYQNSLPKGLLHGKSVSVFTTTGAPSFYYAITGATRRLKNTFKQQFVHFCGMKLTSFKSFGGVDTSAKKPLKILAQIRKIAKH
ncbi:MAG: NAD(P)H-dependent oxidoreductase [Candidatus Cloacimonetes bacterium]|nr:NAD(P)H-dependent oxidoreductase [Candidatus Cloacimonadota bacterium]